jgi:phenylalanyl-tRNA synthetase beta chain
LSRIERLLGIPFSEIAVRTLLEPLGFDVSAGDAPSVGASDTLSVEVPGFRRYDVTREVDLIEEIARTHGYDAFPSELGFYRPGTVPDHPLFQLEDQLRYMLSERGLHEAQTPAFVSEDFGDVRLQNPMSRDESCLRRAVLPSLLRRVEYNFARGERDVRLFELATSFRANESGEGLPRESPHLAVALTGRRAPLHWSGDGGVVDVWDLKGLMEDVARRIGGGARVEPGASTDPWIDAQDSFRLVAGDGSVLGVGGRVAQDALDAPSWAGPVWGFEIALTAPTSANTLTHRALPPYPPVSRDLALVVGDGVPAAGVLTCIREAGGEHLERVDIFDVYRGKGVPEGARSLAFRLRFQSPERTLTDEEVDGAVARVTERLKSDLDVQVRG